MDRVVVKGKTEPVAVYEVLDFHDESTFPGLSEITAVYEEGLRLYRAQNWDAAIRTFQEAMRVSPGDYLSKLYAARCEHFREKPPGKDWNGVWVMETK